MSFGGSSGRESRAESVAVPLAVNRRVYNLRRFDRDFGFIEPDDSWHLKDKLCSNFSCSTKALWNTLCGFVPILYWLPRYNVRENLTSDIIAGVTIAIVHIPQGMAYASLASLQPVYGLYTSFFPTFFYMFLGTSRHVSLGVFAVVSLMVGQVRLSILPDKSDNGDELKELLVGLDNVTTDAPPSDPYATLTPVAVVTALAMLVGLIQVLMGVCRLDFITAYLSDQVVSGFTTGAACHVFTAQLNKILNLKLPRYQGVGKLLKVYRALLESMPNANYATVIMSFATMVVLVIGKEFINPPMKKRGIIPIPWELVVVIGGTVASYFGNFNVQHHMKIVDDIPTGLPKPTLPPIWLFPEMITDAVGIAVVAFVVTVSLGKMFAKKHHYKVDPRQGLSLKFCGQFQREEYIDLQSNVQELYALGFMEMLSSLFSCYPSSTALARSLVYEAAGAKTQLAAAFTTIVLFVVLMWMGPLFKALPMCVLASIIIVALKGMFLQFGQLRHIWPVSKIDFLIWVVSFLATVILDVREGLIVSVLFAVLSAVVRSQRPPSTILARLQETDIYHDVDRYRKIELVPNVCVFRFDSPLMFTNCEWFRVKLFEQCHVDLHAERQLLQQSLAKGDGAAVTLDADDLPRPDTPDAVGTATLDDSGFEASPPKIEPEKIIVKGPNRLSTRSAQRARVPGTKPPAEVDTKPRCHRFVVIDTAGFNYVDYMGINCLMECYTDLTEVGIGLLYANFKTVVRDVLVNANFYSTVPKQTCFPTVHDAVVYAQSALLEDN